MVQRPYQTITGITKLPITSVKEALSDYQWALKTTHRKHSLHESLVKLSLGLQNLPLEMLTQSPGSLIKLSLVSSNYPWKHLTQPPRKPCQIITRLVKLLVEILIKPRRKPYQLWVCVLA